MNTKVSLGITIILMVLELVLAFVATAFMWFGLMGVSCVSNCAPNPFHVMAVVSLVVVIGSYIWVGVRRLKGRETVWIPAIGITALVATYFVCVQFQANF